VAAKLTDTKVQGAIRTAAARGASVWKHESRGRGFGALSLKAGPGGRAHWYYRYAHERKQRYVPIGAYGPGAAEFTLQAARAECERLAGQRAQAPEGDLRGHLALQEAARAAEHRRQVQEVVQAPAHSLHALMLAYAEALEARGKGAARDVRGMTRLHVAGAFPQYAEAPAREFTRRQATEVVRRLVERGHGRSAGKLRSYLRAAFALALRAESDAAAPAAMLAFGLEANPIADTAALPQFNRTRSRALSESELRALWARLTATDTPSALAIRLSLLLGGQRFEQLLRLRLADLDTEAGTLTLYDPKGRRIQPRAHVLPLGKLAGELVAQLAERARAAKVAHLFPASEEKPMDPRTISKFLQAVRRAMIEAGEASDFQLSDLRRSCETRLAELGISKDLRAQIQSHGLGGVQARHYDRYHYLPEKRAALEAWAAWLATKPADNVVPLAKKPRGGKVAA
jgi:integrase